MLADRRGAGGRRGNLIARTPSAAELAVLMDRLTKASGSTFAHLSDPRLLEVWESTVEAFLDPSSPERQAIQQDLVRATRLSPAGLQAGLEAVLGGVRREPAARLLKEAEALRGSRPPKATSRRPAVVFLAGNLPALAVQPLLPALVLRRPVLLKPSSAEPVFAPAFVAALHRREPRLEGTVATALWPGGEEAREREVLLRAGKVLVYGEAETVDQLERRSPVPVVAYGPKASLAILGREAAPQASSTSPAQGSPQGPIQKLAQDLAGDIALFDQRGCLSIHAIYTAGDARVLAFHLAEALEILARRWPPGPSAPEDLAAVQQIRADAELRGLLCPPLAPSAGTVVVEDNPAFRPSPGLRTVRIHPCHNLDALDSVLGPWSGRLQGAALSGHAALALRPRLEQLGVSRFAPPGQLQSPDVTWHNGGQHPLEALS